jgi:ribose transport system permease protein
MDLRRLNLGLERFSGLYLWAIFIAVFAVLAPLTFPTMATVHLLASTQAIAAIVALALLIPMVTGQFDLSIGAIANVAGMTAVIVQTKDVMGPLPAVALGTAVGFVIGAVNGFVVVRLRVSSFIATLAMGSILAAVQVIITGNVEPVPVVNDTWTAMTQADVFGFQFVVVYLVVIALLVWWVLEKTPAGRYMRASGSNPEAARLSGINVDRWSWISLAASGTVSGFAGVLFVSLTGPSLNFGASLLLPAFAAVFLGSTQLTPGRLNVWGTLLAIFVLATGVQGLQLVTGVQWVAAMFNGVALLAAVALASGRERRQAKGVVRRRRGKDMSSGAAPTGPAEPDPAEVPAQKVPSR